MEKINLDSMVDECYNTFISDDTIIGFDSFLRSKGLGSKRIIKLRNLIYKKYGKEELTKIYRSRLSKYSHKIRPKESYKHTDEWNNNIKKGNIESWNSSGEERKEQSKNNMIKYCFPKCQSDSSKKKRVESRKCYKHTIETKQKIGLSHKGISLTEEHKQKLRKPRIRRGVPHSQKTKDKLSIVTKEQWKNGIHKPKYKSKGQLEVIDFLNKLGYITEDEFIINGRPFDVYIKDKNLLIEFNGSFWHRDPRFSKYKNDPTSIKIWNSDKEKIDTAKQMGYDVKVIWQKDWESCENKEEYIKQIL